MREFIGNACIALVIGALLGPFVIPLTIAVALLVFTLGGTALAIVLLENLKARRS